MKCFANKTICAWWLSKVVVEAGALRYARSAQRDERNGFPYTAAMKWRHAAEFSVSDARAADYCWEQWERIMNLPRRLAGPVGASPHRPDVPSIRRAELPSIHNRKSFYISLSTRRNVGGHHAIKFAASAAGNGNGNDKRD